MTKLGNYLSHIQTHQPQVVGNMAVIPLVKKRKSADISSLEALENAYLVNDASYTQLVMKPRNGNPTLIPAGFTYITQERAQDRTIPLSRVLEKETTIEAYCVQSRQNGLMDESAEDKREIRLLPHSVRSYAIYNAMRGHKQVNTLWNYLEQYNSAMGVIGDYLVSLYNRYQHEMAEFVAQFEPVPHQLGCMIVINGGLAGVEIFPSEKYFLSIWEKLIRDQYGTEAIRSAVSDQFKMLSFMNIPVAHSLQELHTIARDCLQLQQNWADDLFEFVCKQETADSSDIRNVSDIHTDSDFKYEAFHTGAFTCQAVLENNQPAYLSAYRRPMSLII